MTDSAPPKTRRRRAAQPPLEVRLTLSYRFGDEPDDTITIMDDRSVPMVNSVFENRDRILRGFVLSLLKAGVSQPRVVREVFPAVSLLKKLTRRRK